MSPPRSKPVAEERAGEDGAAVEQQEAAAAEREAVDEAVAEEAQAAERREAQSDKAAELKSVPEGALAPLEKLGQDGTVSYAHDYLIAHALELTGHPSHVMVGALYGSTKEYISAADATKLADTWLDTEITTTPEQG